MGLRAGGSHSIRFPLAGLHFLCAALCWYTIGRWLESRGSIWKKIVAIYVVARVLTIPASMMLEYDSWWMLCYMLLILAWTIFAMALVVTVLLRLWRRFSSARSKRGNRSVRRALPTERNEEVDMGLSGVAARSLQSCGPVAAIIGHEAG